MHRTRSFLSLVLALVLVLGCCVTAFASVSVETKNDDFNFGGGTVDPSPRPDPTPIETPTKKDEDPTGVGRWLNRKDHIRFLSGYPNGTFAPNANMTRAEAAQMFYNLLLDKDVKLTATFTDVPDSAWYSVAVRTLGSIGVLKEVGGAYEPERDITRAEFTEIAMNFAYKPDAAKVHFTDVAKDAWYYDCVTGAAHYGWIGGYPDGSFKPDKTITRAEVTAIVNRMLGRSADEAFVQKNLSSMTQFGDLTTAHWAYYYIMEATNPHDYEMKTTGEKWTALR